MELKQKRIELKFNNSFDITLADIYLVFLIIQAQIASSNHTEKGSKFVQRDIK